jgi:UDP-glucose 4-epimerase
MGRSPQTISLFVKLWRLGNWVNRMGRWPVVGPLLKPFFRPEANETVVIPVGEAIGAPESVVLPEQALRPLIERASARFIKNYCLCRRAENRPTCPQDIGCLFLGDGAAEIHPALGRLADVDEALAHVRRATGAGLLPQIVHAAFDAWILGIPYRRMLAICFCCDCCCAVRKTLRFGPPIFQETVHRLPGLSVTVGPECVGCGRCAETCLVGAIRVENGRASVAETCKGCGRCVVACPVGAIALHLDSQVDPVGQLIARMERRTEIGG